MRSFFLIPAALFFLSCKHESSKQFQVSGHIKNSTGKMVYLQETPLGSGERITADSSIIGKDGSYSLKSKATEESLFSLFFKGDVYPFAYIINDVSKIVVNADAENQNDYEVKGSDASKSLKEFSVKASGKWSALYALGHEIDSLMKSGVADTSSSLRSINEEGASQLNDLKSYVSGFIKSANDPITCSWALSTNSQVFSMDDYQALLNGIVTKFPAHKGVAKIKEMSDRQVSLSKQKSQAMDEPE